MKQSRLFVAAAAIVLIGSALRLAAIRIPMFGVEGGVNFAPIGAIGLFCGLTFRNRWMAFGLPLLSTLLADVGLAMQNGDFGTYLLNPLMLFVYAAWVLYVCCGRGVRLTWAVFPRGRWVRLLSLGAGSLVGSVLFFVVTNFGVWCLSTTYAKSVSGLAQCYAAAIPFFRATWQSDLLYLFGIVAVFALARVLVADDERSAAVIYAD